MFHLICLNLHLSQFTVSPILILLVVVVVVVVVVVLVVVVAVVVVLGFAPVLTVSPILNEFEPLTLTRKP